MKTFYQNCVFITIDGKEFLTPHVWIFKTKEKAIKNQTNFLEYLLKYYPAESIGLIGVQPLYMEEN